MKAEAFCRVHTCMNPHAFNSIYRWLIFIFILFLFKLLLANIIGVAYIWNVFSMQETFFVIFKS